MPSNFAAIHLMEPALSLAGAYLSLFIVSFNDLLISFIVFGTDCHRLPLLVYADHLIRFFQKCFKHF